MWCIPRITPQFRKLMYEILDLYAEHYDSKRPVIGIDEKPKQLLGQKRNPIPMKPGKPERYDYEYVRKGGVNIFMAIDFKGGKRIARVTDRRTKSDFAQYLKFLVDKVYKNSRVLRLVLDNLNTHNASALFETFDKKEASRILKKIEFHYTPKHASWLNVAEIEIGIMDAQCTGKRIENKDRLTEDVNAWMKERNRKKSKIEWKFTKKDADKKLGKYYVT